MDRLRDILGRRVRSLREQRRLSQEELGKAAKLGGKYIGMIERAEKAASFDAIERIADALEVECYELFVPVHRRTDTIERKIRSLIEAETRGGDSRIEGFLRALMLA